MTSVVGVWVDKEELSLAQNQDAVLIIGIAKPSVNPMIPKPHICILIWTAYTTYPC